MITFKIILAALGILVCFGRAVWLKLKIEEEREREWGFGE